MYLSEVLPLGMLEDRRTNMWLWYVYKNQFGKHLIAWRDQKQSDMRIVCKNKCLSLVATGTVPGSRTARLRRSNWQGASLTPASCYALARFDALCSLQGEDAWQKYFVWFGGDDWLSRAFQNRVIVIGLRKR